MAAKKTRLVEAFELSPGRKLSGKYEVLELMGAGWEGEVYRVREISTDIERAAKLFYPHRNLRGKTSAIYAKKLHKLRDCPILIHYVSQEMIRLRSHDVHMLVSEFVEGQLLSDYINAQRGKVLGVFQAVHLLHALAVGIEDVHDRGEYHGDLHSENIIVRRLGLSFDLKLIDLFHFGRCTAENRRDDLCDLIRIFYDAIGGQKRYAIQPPEVKAICCGLKRSLIVRKFKHVHGLRVYLENQSWS